MDSHTAGGHLERSTVVKVEHVEEPAHESIWSRSSPSVFAAVKPESDALARLEGTVSVADYVPYPTLS